MGHGLRRPLLDPRAAVLAPDARERITSVITSVRPIRGSSRFLHLLLIDVTI